MVQVERYLLCYTLIILSTLQSYTTLEVSIALRYNSAPKRQRRPHHPAPIMSNFTTTILVTGGTTGLGYWATYELARQSPTSKVIIASRSDSQDAARSLNVLLQKQSKGKIVSKRELQVEFLPLDLTSTQNVRIFVQNYGLQLYPPISSLLLNAGIQFHRGNSLHYSPDNVELTFATNHVGHALLFFLLKPHLANDARIILTSSGTHDPTLMAKSRLVSPVAEYKSAELLARPTDNEGYETERKGVQRYASSKLVNVMFTYALERRLQVLRKRTDKQWTVAAFDPGLMPGTSLARDAGPIINWMFLYLGPWLTWLLRLMTGSGNVHSPKESGMSLAGHALTRGEKSIAESGRYFQGTELRDSSVASYDVDKQEDLWRWTVESLGRDDRERAEFERFE